MRRLRRNMNKLRYKKSIRIVKNASKVVVVGFAALTSLISPMTNMVQAYEKAPETMNLPSDHATPSGVADFGRGSASIKIVANSGQTLLGKRFKVYKLFDEENSVDGESVNYQWNSEYKTALQKAVGKRLGKDASKVTEYEVIDYMHSLDDTPKTPEGAHPGTGNPDVMPQLDNKKQQLEGRYSDFRYFVEELRDELVRQNKKADSVEVTDVDSDGNITLNGLDYGYYLTDEVYMSGDKHSAASLIMTNTANPEGRVNIKSDYPEIQKKVFEDDIPDTFDNTHGGPTKEELGTWSDEWKSNQGPREKANVTSNVNLNKTGWQDIVDYEIGQKVPYEFRTVTPDMNGYHSYKFLIHDKMDKELTFHSDSVQIEIVGNEDKKEKTYVLDSSEFVIKENIGEDTFQIEIDDLKNIVDREFRSNFDSHNHNVYGQEIRIRYDATLNDDARFDTGRPGFENSVQLEFSNNPDSNGEGQTGRTPWDTVVVFTYELDGVKLNNHDKVLAGAEFKLFTDKQCTNEVYVKEVDNDYIVMNRDSLGGSDHLGGTAPSEAVNIVSGKQGEFKIYGLDQGTYFLKEMKAPKGYRKLLNPIELEVKPTFTLDRDSYVKGEGATDKILQNLEVKAQSSSFFGGVLHSSETQLETDVEKGSANITVVNQVGKIMPQTGGIGWVVFAAGTCLAGGAVLVTLKMRKEQK